MFVNWGVLNFLFLFLFYTTSYGIMQISTNPRRQSRCVDLRAKGAKVSHSHHIYPHYMAWHGQPRRAFFLSLFKTPPTPLPQSALSALKTTTGSSTAMLSENAISKDTYPISATLNPTNTAPVSWPSSAAGRPTLTGGMSTGRIAGTLHFSDVGFPPPVRTR
jgi:hypothetical protein